MTRNKLIVLLIALFTFWWGVPAHAASGTPIAVDAQESSANPRLVRLTHGADKGAILASVAPGEIYKSVDEGSSFSKLRGIAYPSDVTWDCCGVLYEMPQAVGVIPAGTVLFSADNCEGDVMSTNIYASSDGGDSWTFLAAPVRGGECKKDNSGIVKGVSGKGLWEPSFGNA